MKIAIPTNNGFTISEDFKADQGFLITVIQLGQIVQQELRSNVTENSLSTQFEFFNILKDCDGVIVSEINENEAQFLKSNEIEVVTTAETIITRALLQYIGEDILQESNTCCCP